MPFEHQRRIRFQDADPAGIVFFGHVLTFCHEAYEELLRAEGLPLESLLASGAGYPLRHAEVDFTAPMRVGMLVRVAVAVSKLGERSFHLAFTLRDEAGVALATAATVHICVERAAMRAVPLPDAVRAALARHVSG
jgi:YbgC/YbaW family acyl-CoA thioester hydrolase